MATALTTVLLGGACSRSFDAYCDDFSDCIDGNTEDTNACIRAVEAEEEVAALFGCQEEFDALQDCREDESDCENDSFFVPANECNDEEREYSNCIGS